MSKGKVLDLSRTDLESSSSEPGFSIISMMIVLFIVLARNKLRIPLEGTYSREM